MMSTRTQLVVKTNEKVKIYKHCDGYPSYVIPFLQEFLPRFKAGRGWDSECLTAHLSSALIQYDRDLQKAFYKRMKAENPSKAWDNYDNEFGFLGHGLDTTWHGDIEYAYRIMPDFGVEVYTSGWAIGKGGWLKGAKPVKVYTFDELVKATDVKD
jgi:hypothetical protein